MEGGERRGEESKEEREDIGEERREEREGEGGEERGERREERGAPEPPCRGGARHAAFA